MLDFYVIQKNPKEIYEILESKICPVIMSYIT